LWHSWAWQPSWPSQSTQPSWLTQHYQDYDVNYDNRAADSCSHSICFPIQCGLLWPALLSLLSFYQHSSITRLSLSGFSSFLHCANCLLYSLVITQQVMCVLFSTIALASLYNTCGSFILLRHLLCQVALLLPLGYLMYYLRSLTGLETLIPYSPYSTLQSTTPSAFTLPIVNAVLPAPLSQTHDGSSHILSHYIYILRLRGSSLMISDSRVQCPWYFLFAQLACTPSKPL